MLNYRVCEPIVKGACHKEEAFGDTGQVKNKKVILVKEYNYVIIPTYVIPKSQYDLLDNLFIVPLWGRSDEPEFYFDASAKTISAIALCKEIDGGRQLITFELCKDFVVFHCFISGDNLPYRALEKTELTVERTSFEAKEDFIESIRRGDVRADKYTGEFDQFPPFYDDIFKNPELGLSYRKTFERFLEAKNKGDRIYKYIRLYVFSKNYTRISKAYQNDNLSMSLLYTILDALLGEPERCSNALNCDVCGCKIESHYKESLAKYQNKKIKEKLNSGGCDLGSVKLYQKLLKNINHIRGATYHKASYINYFEESLKETQKSDYPKEEVREDWSLERIVNDKLGNYTAKKLMLYTFEDFIKILLINELIGERKFYPKLKRFSVITGTTGYRKKSRND